MEAVLALTLAFVPASWTRRAACCALVGDDSASSMRTVLGLGRLGPPAPAPAPAPVPADPPEAAAVAVTSETPTSLEPSPA